MYGKIDVILLLIICMIEDVYFMYLLKLDLIVKKFIFCCVLGYLYVFCINFFKFLCSNVVVVFNIFIKI